MNIEEARAIREARAKHLRSLQSQEVWLEDLLRDTPRSLNGCTILKLLRAVRHLGETRVRTVLNQCQIDPGTKVGTLTPIERIRILEQMPNAARKTNS